MKISGIYKIINRTNSKYYVGSSINITGGKGRWARHRTDLKYNRHDNEHLQRAWNECGCENFEFVLIEKLDNLTRKELLLAEQKYLDVAKTEPDMCYNMNFDAFGTKYVRDEVTQKKRNSQNGRVFSEKSKRRMSEARKGWVYSVETIEKMKIAKGGKNHPLYGKQHSEKTKTKMSLSKLGCNNNRYDSTIRKFVNRITNEVFEGTQFEFSRKYNLNSGNVNLMVNGRKYRKSVGGWFLQTANENYSRFSNI